MRDETTLALRPDLFGQLAATDPFQGRARRLYERGQVLAVNGNQADVRVGYDARNNPLDLKEVPIVSGYIPRVGDWVAIQYEAGHSGAPWVAGPSMAADESEDTPGIGVFSVSSEEPADPQTSTVYFHEPASTWRGWNGAAWVDLGSGGGGGLHNALPDLQGGAAGQYYHLTAAQWSALVGNMPFGAGAVLYADSSGHLADDAGNFSWDAANKRLGIGTNAPEQQFHIVSQDAYAWQRMDAVGDGAFCSPIIQFFRARGTIATPTAILDGDSLFSQRSYGYGDAWGREGYRLIVLADGDWSATNRGVYWYVSGVHPGTTALANWLQVRNGQHLFPPGSAAAPPISFMGYPTMGMYAHSSAVLAWAVGGAFQMGLSADGLGIGINPGGFGRKLYCYGSVAGDLSHVYQNASTDAAAGYYHYWLTAGGGDLYTRYACPGSQWWACGIRQSDDKWVWSNYFDLSTAPTTQDRMTLDRNGVVWWKPHSPTLTADGQAAMDSVHDTWVYRFNATNLLGASLTDDARVTTNQVPDVGGELAETTISSHSLKSGFSVSGNTYTVKARGTAKCKPKVTGGGATLHVRFYIEGTLLFQLTLSPPQASGAYWLWYEFSFDATLRSSTEWMISDVKARYKAWDGAPPWPTTVSGVGGGLSEMDYLRDTVFTVSGDVVNAVKGCITNGLAGESYVSAFEHKAGLGQV